MLVLLITTITSCHSQTTVKKDANGNYTAIRSSRSDSTVAKPTGKTYTDTKGNVYPVYISINNKLYIIRTSRTGNKYKQYLKL